MITHQILFGFYITYPESVGSDFGFGGEDYNAKHPMIGHAENILKLLNNVLLLISMNIALNNWTSYNFQVGKQIQLKLENEEK